MYLSHHEFDNDFKIEMKDNDVAVIEANDM